MDNKMASSAYPNLLNNESGGVDPRLHPQSYSTHNGEVPEAGRQNEQRRASTQQFDEYESDSDGQGQDGKKRKRPMSVSCELCKQRKVKCDRGQPNCGWCLRNSQICEYRERKKPGLRAGYGRELEARLDRLEGIIASQSNAIAMLTSNGAHGAPQATMNTLAPIQATSPQETNLFASPNILNRPELGQMRAASSATIPYSPRSPNVIDQGSRQQMYGSISNPSYPQSTPESFARPEPTPAIQPPEQQSYYAAGGIALTNPVPANDDHELPPYDLLYSLTDLYFKHVNTWCPILHRRTTFDTLFGASSLDEADRMVLHAIVAVTLRFSADSRLDEAARTRYYETSKRKVLLFGLENSSVRAITALVILALDLTGESNGPKGWNVLALLARSTVQLGLSIEVTSPAVQPRFPSIYTLRAMILPDAMTWVEDESRRRLFWMVYILDRYATVATAFEFALDEKEIDRRLPCRDDLFMKNQNVETRWFRNKDRTDWLNNADNLGSFSYYVEVVGIMSRIHEFLKIPIDIMALGDVEQWQKQYRELDATLTSWKNSLPREYNSTAQLFDNAASKNINCGWVMLHVAYHTTIIRLHSSAGYPARRSPLFAPSFRASQYCLTAVESLSALCAHVKNNGMLNKLGPPFAFSVWVAARLLLVHSSTIDHKINPSVNYFVTVLREIGTYWPVADRYAQLLQRVLDEFTESEKAAVTMPNGERATPSTVKILADMRRTAYDLDFLISRQPTNQVASAAAGMSAVVTPAKGQSPAMGDMEFLDVFNFFNMPRLPPMNGEGAAPEAVPGQGYGDVPDSYDANSDWVLRGPTPA